jgi:hypothetical protein
MSWFRLDDKFHSNQKVIAARNAAVGLYVRCGTWSADQGTEGRIPSHVALMFGTKAEIARVSAAGLWQPTDYGYLIRDYLEYNLSNEEVADRRDKRAEAGRAGGIKSGESRRSKREASASDSGKQNEANTNPDPTRPDPTPLVPVVDELDDSTCVVLRGAAVMYAEWKFASNPSACKGLSSKYKAGIVANVLTEQAAELSAYIKRHPNATAADIAGRVLGVPGLGNTTPPPAPDWHADPHCEHCDGSGIARLDDIGQGTYGPCECRRPEPYPDADVIEMRWA